MEIIILMVMYQSKDNLIFFIIEIFQQYNLPLFPWGFLDLLIYDYKNHNELKNHLFFYSPNEKV